MTICRDALEEWVLNALRHNLVKPELFQEFCDEFTQEMNKLRMQGRAEIEPAKAEIRTIDRELDTSRTGYPRTVICCTASRLNSSL